MKNRLVISSFCILLTCAVYSQKSNVSRPTYRTAIGVRFYPLGISMKLNSEYKKSSIEFNGYFKDGFTIGALYEWNFVLNTTRNLRAFFGPGARIGFLEEKAGGGALGGVGGVVGLDYKFLHLPLNLSLDWQPSLQFGNTNKFTGWGGLGVRFTL